jgi:hypothetical protein
LLLVGLLPVASVRAADLPATANNPANIPLIPNGAPGSDRGPDLVPFLPPSAHNTGTGLLLILSNPSLFFNQAADQGAAPMVHWLNNHGLAAFVLVYNGSQSFSPNEETRDANLALQYLHAHAADFHLSANRIGVIGFGPGADIAANAAFANPSPNGLDSTDTVAQASPHPDFLALIDGGSIPSTIAAWPPPTFLVGSTNAADNLSGMIDLWTYLRSPQLKVPVEAHFFPKVEANDGIDASSPSLGTWPNLFYNWIRAYGFLTDQPRVAIHGSVLLDGRPLPFGYVILTPIDFIGAGPIVAHVFNSTAGVAIGSFSVPAKLGPVPGRYKVDVRQNANRWLSNAFSNDLIRDPAFGHSRILSPSIDDQHSFTKAHPGDKDDLVIEIKPDGNPDLNIAVFNQ